MATAEADTSRGERVPAGGVVYDGFISYSHAADDLLAPRLQAGMQRFAKPWWKRRALRIFRDESSLSANPHLWSSITDALDGSGWFVLLLSPDAAESPWVNQEIEYWLEHRDPERIIPVLTDGTFGWTDGDITGDAVPPALQGAFIDEPRWVDLRFARTEEQLDLNNPRFSAAVADVASAIRGVPKDELESEEVRQHRRTARTAWAAGFALVTLVIAASGTAVFAVAQQNRANGEADRANTLADQEAAARGDAETAREAEAAQRVEAELQADRARAESLAANSSGQIGIDNDLAILLALESLNEVETPTAMSALHGALQAHRTVWAYEPPEGVDAVDLVTALHPQGDRVVTVTAAGLAQLWDVNVEPGDVPIWETSLALEGEDWVDMGVFSSTVWFAGNDDILLPVSDALFSEEPGVFQGIFRIDAESGAVIEYVDMGRCFGGAFPSESSSTSDPVLVTFFSVTDDGCDTQVWDRIAVRHDGPHGIADVVLQPGIDLEQVQLPLGWTEDLSLVSLGSDAGAFVFDADTGDLAHQIPSSRGSTGIGVISSDGSEILVSNTGRIERRTVDAGDLLMAYPGEFSQAYFSPEGDSVIALSFDGSVKIFDRESGALRLELRGIQTRPTHISTGEDAELILVAAFEDTRMYSLAPVASELPVPTVDIGERIGTSANVSTGGGLLLIPYDEGGGVRGYRIIDPQSGDIIRHAEGTWGMAKLSPDGMAVAEVPLLSAGVANGDGDVTNLYGQLRLVDARNGNTIRVFNDTCSFYETISQSWIERPQPGTDCADTSIFMQPNDMEFSADGKRLAMDSQEGKPTVFDVETGAVAFTTSIDMPVGTPKSIALSPDGSIVIHRAVDYLPFDFAAVEVDTGTILAEVSQCSVNSEMLFSPDGSLLYTADWCSDVATYDTTNWEQTDRIKRAQGGILGDLALSGSRAATVGYDDTLRVWDVDSTKILLEIELAEPAGNVEFIDQDHVLVITDGGDLLLFTLDPSTLVSLAIPHLTRGFTRQECRTYEIDLCPTLEEIRNR